MRSSRRGIPVPSISPGVLRALFPPLLLSLTASAVHHEFHGEFEGRYTEAYETSGEGALPTEARVSEILDAAVGRTGRPWLTPEELDILVREPDPCRAEGRVPVPLEGLYATQAGYHLVLQSGDRSGQVTALRGFDGENGITGSPTVVTENLAADSVAAKGDSSGRTLRDELVTVLVEDLTGFSLCELATVEATAEPARLDLSGGPRTATITVRVRSAESGEPGGELRVEISGSRLGTLAEGRGKTDASGRFTTTYTAGSAGVERLDVSVRAADGHVTASTVLEITIGGGLVVGIGTEYEVRVPNAAKAENREAELQIVVGRRAGERVVPVPGVEVEVGGRLGRLSRTQGRTSAQGRFVTVYTAERAGDETITVRARDPETGETGTGTVHIENRELRPTVELELVWKVEPPDLNAAEGAFDPQGWLSRISAADSLAAQWLTPEERAELEAAKREIQQAMPEISGAMPDIQRMMGEAGAGMAGASGLAVPTLGLGGEAEVNWDDCSSGDYARREWTLDPAEGVSGTTVSRSDGVAGGGGQARYEVRAEVSGARASFHLSAGATAVRPPPGRACPSAESSARASGFMAASVRIEGGIPPGLELDLVVTGRGRASGSNVSYFLPGAGLRFGESGEGRQVIQLRPEEGMYGYDPQMGSLYVGGIGMGGGEVSVAPESGSESGEVRIQVEVDVVF